MDTEPGRSTPANPLLNQRLMSLSGVATLATMGMDRSVSRKGNKVYLNEENDGATFLRRGAEPTQTEMLSVDEAGVTLAGGGRFSSSGGHLKKQAVTYFAEIAREHPSSS